MFFDAHPKHVCITDQHEHSRGGSSTPPHNQRRSQPALREVPSPYILQPAAQAASVRSSAAATICGGCGGVAHAPPRHSGHRRAYNVEHIRQTTTKILRHVCLLSVRTTLEVRLVAAPQAKQPSEPMARPTNIQTMGGTAKKSTYRGGC